MVKNTGFSDIFGVDTTLAGAILVGLLAIARINKSIRLLPRLTPVIFFVLCMLPSAASLGHSEYSHGKLLKLITLTFPVASAIGLSTDSLSRLRALFLLLGASGVLACGLALSTGPSSTEYGRFAVGDDVLALGYPAATSIVVLGGMLITAQGRKTWKIPLLLTVALVMLASGSRGPLLGSIIALLVGILYSRGRRSGGLLWLTFLGMTITALWSWIPQVSRDRLLHSNLEATSISARLELYRLATNAFLDNPLFGVGFGAFQERTGAAFVYPHNIFAEVAAETGLAGLVGLLILLISVFKTFQSKLPTCESVTLVMLLVLYLTKSLFSSDLTSRDLWMTLCVTLMMRPLLPSKVQAPVIVPKPPNNPSISD